MRTIYTKRTTRIASALLIIWIVNIIFPASLYALTSGPAQPESQSFQPAGVSDMVDLSTGDFKYNIPLMDVDGYPLNLNYQSGVGIDDEASWVGLGWNLNVGSISRQLRGVPDDFSGDELTTTHDTKPKVTIGGKVSVKYEFKGRATLGGSFSLGVFSDNYVGVGAEIGVNAGISLDKTNSNSLTAGMGVGVLSNTASGVDVTPSLSIGIKEQTTEKYAARAGLSSSLGYNSRSGMKSLTLGSSFSLFNPTLSTISYNTEPIMPKIQVPRKSSYSSFSFDIGPAIFGSYTSLGGMGYRNVNEVVSKTLTNPEYGFLYAERGKNDKKAIMDFVREKDNPIVTELPNLALPVHTPDLFSYTSQNGSGQFRLYRGGTGAFFDNEAIDKSTVNTFGGDIGFGGYLHAGASAFNQDATTITRKWKSDNQYLIRGDFQDQSYTDFAKEHVFFRKVDEKSREDVLLSNKLKGTSVIAVNTVGKSADQSFRDNSNYYATSLAVDSLIEKKSRQPKTTVISYLTAAEAEQAGLDKTINTYPALLVSDVPSNGPMSLPVSNLALPRIQANKAAKHHISEMTVTGMGGERMIYGIPVYNTKQEEYSFAVGRATSDYNLIAGNLIGLNLAEGEIDHKKGIDQYYHKESLPAYATSFLLTALVSPDYQDKTSNGISDDDQGTVIKFNYSKIDKYRWRTPYAARSGSSFVKAATLNKGLLADPVDDKGSIVYGEKELYYVQSIESKTQIAYFITADRLDGLGVVDYKGDREYDIKQKCLKEIRLYSKADLSKPIKVVKFEYSYELCPGTPNSIGHSVTNYEDRIGNNNGKLTLKKVWFEYGNASKGKYHPYIFEYNKLNSAGTLATYASLSTDRWGVYKLNTANPSTFSNDEFPYADQNATNANINAGLFHLSKITLPTGGNIDVVYEADDYAYVQDKKATVMTSVQSFNGDSGTLKNATGLTIPLDEPLPSSIGTTDYAKVLAWFKKTYLNGSDYLYTKSYVKVSTPNANSYTNDYDFISAYCKVNRVEVSGSTALIKFEPVTEGGVTQNPILFAARQKMKNEYPRYAYPGFENSIKADNAAKALAAAVGAIVDAAKNLSELKENFYQKANRTGKDYAVNVNTAKSFVRLTKNSGHKLGGGLRVKKIAISDNWDDFTSSAVPEGVYGQSYEYTKQENGKVISSGVASYEPAVGNDENPLKQPVPYIQKIKGAINNFFELEEPFGESFFPSPSVIYSKVTVKDLEAGGTYTANPKTGSIVNEFYTAKDFPVKVRILPIQKFNPRPQSTFSLVKTNSEEQMILSQGYCIELNDMHGKSKATRVLNQAGAEISSSVYHYQVEDPNAESLKLDNKVSVIDNKGTVIPNQVIGRDIELFTDFREQEYKNSGQALNLGGDLIPLFFGIPFPLPHFPVGINNDYKLFRSVCAVKVVQSFGILKKVVKTENGSSIAVENMAYDAITGDAIVTKTQNEFGKDYYSVNLPAYWVYKGMGPAYQTLGTLLKGVITNASGNIYGSIYTNFLMPGDELVDITSGNHYWVIETLGAKKLIDKNGAAKIGVISLAKIIRSGYRNQLQPTTSTLVCLNNPIQGNVFRLASGGDLTDLQVINASTNLFDESWAVNSRKSEVLGNEPWFIYDDFVYPTGTSFTAYKLSSPNVSLTTYWNTKAFAEYVSINPVIPDETIYPFNILEYLGFTGFDYCLYVPESGYYSLGKYFGTVIYIDNERWTEPFYAGYPGVCWNIIPNQMYMTAGYHKLTLEIWGGSSIDFQGIGGAEIYKNTVEQLTAVDSYGTGINRIFSTSSVKGNTNLHSVIWDDSGSYGSSWYYHYQNTDGSFPNPCIPITSVNTDLRTNPYLNGYLGNWHPYQTKVYQEKRNYSEIFKEGTKGINAKNAGFYGSYMPWWKSNGTTWTTESPAKWITANTITLYDKYGQELENKDALGRYSAANFDFNGELPAAVASNAMNREIFTNSFEDERFKASHGADTIKTKFKDNATGAAITSITTSAEAHTGTFSLALTTTGVTLATKTHNNQHKTGNYLSAGANGYQLGSGNIYPNGFEPVPAKEYIISAWVKDFQPNNRNVNITAQTKTNGASPVSVTLTCKAVVEGWKLLEGKFTATTADQFEVVLKANSGTVYLDDVRIHPKDAHLKSYAYSYKNFKLMAELDENAFATFYEYDDEGSLIRVKKETERGIMTLKETRASYRKNPIIP